MFCVKKFTIHVEIHHVFIKDSQPQNGSIMYTLKYVYIKNYEFKDNVTNLYQSINKFYSSKGAYRVNSYRE